MRGGWDDVVVHCCMRTDNRMCVGPDGLGVVNPMIVFIIELSAGSGRCYNGCVQRHGVADACNS